MSTIPQLLKECCNVKNCGSWTFFDSMEFDEEFRNGVVEIDENQFVILYEKKGVVGKLIINKLRKDPAVTYIKSSGANSIMKEYDWMACPITRIKTILEKNNIELNLSDWVNEKYIRDHDYKFSKITKEYNGQTCYVFEGDSDRSYEYIIEICPDNKEATVIENHIPFEEDDWEFINVIPWSPEYDDGIQYN